MRKKPFVSLANLVEYATTPSAPRRHQIIEQYHNPEVVRFDWHGASDTIFVQRACGSTAADHLIDIEKRRIKDQLIGHKEKDRRNRHILHLIELLEASDLLRLTKGTQGSAAGELSVDFSVGNLTVRVRPSLVLSRSKAGKRYPELGILKCHNLSTFKLSEATGQLYAVGLQVYAENVLDADSVCPELCRAYDLFADTVHSAPKNQKRLRTQIFDAAQEIVDRWEAVGRRISEATERSGEPAKGCSPSSAFEVGMLKRHPYLRHPRASEAQTLGSMP